jgi:uncharacterized SAM-binding protein YcdF (DUF218 family)
LILLALVLWLWVVFTLVIVIDAYGRVDRARPADVIIVLGAGLRPDNSPGPALIRRAAQAAALWKSGYAPILICSGGNPGNKTRSEADACMELLSTHDIPNSAVLLEDRSRSTEENAIECREIMQANGWQTAIIVSDSFHLFRAYRLFRNTNMIVYPSPASTYPDTVTYVVFLAREVVAFHWQLIKEAFNLPITYVQSI